METDLAVSMLITKEAEDRLFEVYHAASIPNYPMGDFLSWLGETFPNVVWVSYGMKHPLEGTFPDEQSAMEFKLTWM